MKRGLIHCEIVLLRETQAISMTDGTNRHLDFLEVSGTHESARLALCDQAMWDKYQLATLADGDFKSNTLIFAKAVPTDPATHEDPKSMFGPVGNTIPALQQRAVVFMAPQKAKPEIDPHTKKRILLVCQNNIASSVSR